NLGTPCQSGHRPAAPRHRPPGRAVPAEAVDAAAGRCGGQRSDPADGDAAHTGAGTGGEATGSPESRTPCRDRVGDVPAVSLRLQHAGRPPRVGRAAVVPLLRSRGPGASRAAGARGAGLAHPPPRGRFRHGLARRAGVHRERPERAGEPGRSGAHVHDAARCGAGERHVHVRPGRVPLRRARARPGARRLGGGARGGSGRRLPLGGSRHAPRLPGVRGGDQGHQDAEDDLQLAQAGRTGDPRRAVRVGGDQSKYFFAATMAIQENQPQFGGVVVVGGDRPAKIASRAAVWATLPVPPGGEFRYDVYVGPLEHHRLAALGHGLDDANPYGWSFFRPLIHPVSLWVVAILTWMHDQMGLAYGWVLIFFGILVRLLLWPLNQKAMASQLRMQAAAPLLKDAQERYKDSPEKLQKEMMRIYKEYNVNPFGGCLPMFLPLPVLFALFFVFANTIEFRGVPFLWLPDLSRPDPLYIIPVVMGLTMFAVSKVGQIGMPPNPQTKMLLYFMPAFLTFVFLRF